MLQTRLIRRMRIHLQSFVKNLFQNCSQEKDKTHSGLIVKQTGNSEESNTAYTIGKASQSNNDNLVFIIVCRQEVNL